MIQFTLVSFKAESGKVKGFSFIQMVRFTMDFGLEISVQVLAFWSIAMATNTEENGSATMLMAKGLSLE